MQFSSTQPIKASILSDSVTTENAVEIIIKSGTKEAMNKLNGFKLEKNK